MPEELILASASPRRRELLELIGQPFTVCPSGWTEEKLTADSFSRGVEWLALEKARRVAEHFARGVVLGADTVVELEGEIMGKPENKKEARRMLGKLSGRNHRVYTGLALLSASHPEKKTLEHAVTEVKFRPLEEEEVEDYLEKEDWADKAGAYAIQGRAGVFVEGINGCYFNVVGLPLSLTYLLLRRWGFRPG